MAGSLISALGSFFSFGGKPAKTPTTQPGGSDGVLAPGGFFQSWERNPDLVGTNLQKTFINTMHQTAIIAAAVRAYLGLSGEAAWSTEPNEAGGTKGKKAADLVMFGLLDAPMDQPWNAAVEKQAYHHLGGFAIHEWTIRRRSDGRVVFADLGHRPQSTIWRWQKDDERKPLQGVEQLTVWGSRYYMPRERLWYTVDNTLDDSPQGMGVLRHVVEPARRLELLTRWEAFAYEKNLRGNPAGYAPLKDLEDKAKSLNLQGDQAKAYIAKYTKPLTDLLESHLKGKTNAGGLLLDSETYRSRDQAQTVSAIPKWALKIIEGDSGPLAEINATIKRITWEIATILQSEWLLIGMDTGTYNLHDNKTAMMARAINRINGRIGASATRDLARPLTAMNGYDPETCTPKVKAAPMAIESVAQTSKTLLDLAQAGAPMMPDDPAIDQVRRRLYLDAQPKMTPDLGLPRRPSLLPREPIQDETPGLAPKEPQYLGLPSGQVGSNAAAVPETPGRAGKEPK